MTARMLQTTPYGSTFDSMLTEYLDKNLGKLILGALPVADWLRKEGRIRRLKNLSGSQIRFPVELRSGSGFGPRGEGDALPASDPVDTIYGNVPYRRGIKGRIELTSEALSFGRAGAQNLADVVKQEVRNAYNTMRLQAIPAIWGAGNGLLAHINGAVSSDATVILDGVETYSECSPGTRWLHPGMKVISVLSTTAYAADAAMAAAVEIDSITDYLDLEMASAIDATDDYYLVEHHCSNTSTGAELLKGSVTIGTASSYRGPLGLTAMCDDGTLLSSYAGISETSYPQWVATLSHNSGTRRALSLDLYYGLFGKLTRLSNDMKPGLVDWHNWDIHQALVDLLEPFVEFRPRKLEAGFDEFDIMVNGVPIPIKIDHGAPGYIYMLNPSKIVFAEAMAPAVWKVGAAADGWRDVADKTNAEKKFQWMFNVYTTNRPAQGRICDITHTIRAW